MTLRAISRTESPRTGDVKIRLSLCYVIAFLALTILCGTSHEFAHLSCASRAPAIVWRLLPPRGPVHFLLAIWLLAIPPLVYGITRTPPERNRLDA